MLTPTDLKNRLDEDIVHALSKDKDKHMNKARLAEAGRGIIQFEIFFRFAKKSFTSQEVERLSRYYVPQLST